MGFGLTGIGSFLTGGDVAGDTAKTIGTDAQVFGKKPKIADYTALNLTDEQAKAIEGNLTNADAMTELLDKLMPGFSDTERSGLSSAAALTRGEIPQDMQDAITRVSAFQSLMGGFSGTQMGSALTARDLGLTSLDLMQRGQNSFQNWTKIAESSYDPFIIKTMQQASATAANNAGKQATDQYRFNVEAAPDPAAAAKYAIDSAIGMKMLDFGIGAAGAAMGAGGGGQQQQQQPMGYNVPSGSQFNAAQASSVWGSSLGNSLGGGYAAPGAFQYNPSTGQYEQFNSSGYGGG